MSDAPRTSARIRKHSIVISGHQTSISLEDAFWRALKDIAAMEQLALAALVARVDARRNEANLSSALRVFVLERALQGDVPARPAGAGAAPPPQ